LLRLANDDLTFWLALTATGLGVVAGTDTKGRLPRPTRFDDTRRGDGAGDSDGICILLRASILCVDIGVARGLGVELRAVLPLEFRIPV
jgi:hypothetical protein